MTDLEKRINALVNSLAPNSLTSKTLSGIKKTLNSSSNLVDSINNIGDRLQDNIEESVGGVTGSVSGWIAGKTTQFAGGIAGGIVAGTLKTVAGIIPDSSDIKLPESDKKVAHCIATFSLPTEKLELFELLQYTWNAINSKSNPYGKQTIDAFKTCHSKVYSTLIIAAKDDNELLQLSKSFAPKKRFGIF